MVRGGGQFVVQNGEIIPRFDCTPAGSTELTFTGVVFTTACLA
jgi:hypothetical protein